jgi:hypothetical protein
MGSGENIQAGRVTTAESTTDLLGAVPTEQDVGFNGIVILRVAPQPGLLEPLDDILDGIHGVGHSGVVAPGGTGVVGFGGHEQGTGIAGLGGGINGQGGIGVQGTGGNVDTIVEPIAPGPGVLGRGGVPMPRKEDPVAAGVIGLAGDTAIPLISESGNVGVYGAGPTGGVRGAGDQFGVEGLSNFMGVSGQGVHGPGVNGLGRPGVVGIAADDSPRGGEFDSKRSAQVRLVPQQLQQRIPNQVTVTPTAIPAGSEPALPKDGRAGDLMVIEMDTEDKQRVCRLWFCVQSATSGHPARWAQVLVGSSFDGKV